MSRRALLLDRDGTLVHHRPYPSRPQDLVLFDGVGTLLYRLQRAGFALILITNQAGLARGLFTVDDLHHMHDHLRKDLADFDVTLDGIYYCPHHIEGVIPELAVSCDCRKPAPGMLLRAARELKLDLATSWMVGDTPADAEAGMRAGCRTVLVGDHDEPGGAHSHECSHFVVRGPTEALRLILTVEGIG